MGLFYNALFIIIIMLKNYYHLDMCQQLSFKIFTTKSFWKRQWRSRLYQHYHNKPYRFLAPYILLPSWTV